MPMIFVPKLIRANAFTFNDQGWLASINNRSVNYYTAGLLAWWRFLEGTGTVANDSSGNSETGTLINGGSGYPIWGTGPTSAAGSLTFNGSNNYVNTSNFADNPTNLTVCAWFKTTQVVGNEYVVVSKLGGTYGDVLKGTGWYMAQSSDVVPNAMMVGIQNGGGDNYWQIYSSTACNDGNWHHVTLVINSTGGENGNITMYYNGTNVGGSNNQVVGTNPYGSISNSSNVRVGNDYAQTDAQPPNDVWDGPIADVRIYNAALSSTIISEIHAGTA